MKRILNELGIMKFATKDFEHALKDFADSLEIYQGAGNNQGIARTLNNIGATYFAMGDLQSALDMFDEALEVQRSDLVENFGKRNHRHEEKDVFKVALTGVSETLCNMGYLHKAKRSTCASSFFLEEALRIYNAISDDDEPHDRMIDEMYFIMNHLDSGDDLCEL
jgi:tetratricopeptide (TPR) repeat protein